MTLSEAITKHADIAERCGGEVKVSTGTLRLWAINAELSERTQFHHEMLPEARRKQLYAELRER